MEAGALRAPAAINRISVTAPLLRLRSDEQLVALFRAGSDAAFSVIHDRYRQRLRAWLYRVAHNRCVDHLRKPIPPAIDLFDTSRRPLHDPIAEAERRDDLRRLIEDVRRLPA